MIPTDYTITRAGMTAYLKPLPPWDIVDIIVKATSYEKPGKQHMPNPAWAIVKLARVRADCIAFPHGLTARVVQTLEGIKEKHPHLVTSIDVYKNLPLESGFGRDAVEGLRDYQAASINALMLNGGGILCLPTGAGKTFTALEFLRVNDLTATVVVHTLDLKKQWQDAIAAYPKPLPRINVCTFQSPLTEHTLSINKAVVFDECHHVAAKNVYKLAMTSARNRLAPTLIGLSATPYREDNADLVIEAALGPIVYSVTRRQLIEQGYLVDAKVFYIPVEFATNKFETYQEQYERCIVQNELRNNNAVHAALSEALEGSKVLVLVNHIEHGELILEKITAANGKACFLHGKVKDRTVDFDKTPIVIGTQIFNEGVDLPALDVVVLAGGGKSSIRLTQQVGRVLRNKPGKKKATIYDFIDTPRHLARHYKKRREELSRDFEVEEIRW